MLPRTRYSLPLIALLALAAPAIAANLDGSPPEVGNAEALRLYRDANDLVTNVTEGDYSYAYMQFYWKRAQFFVDRAMRMYPDSPTAQALKADRLPIGPYELAYFRDRVLPRLEEKRTYTVDEVSCANFLYELGKGRTDPVHEATYEGIVEVMARQERWGEVMAFPTLPEQRVDFLRTIFQVAARSPLDHRRLIGQLLADTLPKDQRAAGFRPILAEAQVLLGRPRADIAKFVEEYPEEDVKLAVLRGTIDREVEIRRRIALRLDVADEIDATHFTLLNLGVRDDVEAVARKLFPAGLPQAAQDLVAGYRAALGSRPAADVPNEVRLAYADCLGALERYDELESFLSYPGLPESARLPCALKAVELYACAGRPADAERWKTRCEAAGATADEIELSDFRGQIESVDAPLTVRSKTFVSLPFRDPCELARAIVEWSLAPIRSIRGAGPWDAIVLKYEPGFANLPLPKSNAVREAAGADEPF